MDEYSSRHKKHKHKKKKKHSRHSSESEDEWVEKKEKSTRSEHKATESSISNEDNQKTSNKRDDWMSLEMDFSSIGSKKETKKEVKDEKPVIEQVGQSSRELNPYWRNGGTGLPPEKSEFDEGRNGRYSRNSEKNKSESTPERRKHHTEYEQDVYKSQKSFKNKPEERSRGEMEDERRREPSGNKFESSKKGERRRNDDGDRERMKAFKKPQYGEDDHESFSRSHRETDTLAGWNKSSCSSSSTGTSSRKGWRKTDLENQRRSESRESTSKTEQPPDFDTELSSTYEMEVIDQDPQKVLSLNELNRLYAKMFKAELKGNVQLAKELQIQVDKANKLRSNTKADEIGQEMTKEIIVLTETDSKGFTRPLKSVRDERLSSKRKVETHEGNKRVRYFADDDSQSLSEMFEKERFSSSRDQNATFMKLMGKEMSEKNEDAFEETASVDNVNRQERKNWDTVVRETSQREKALENCFWCLDSKGVNQEVIVAIRNKVHLCVPNTQSLTDGHCVIVPSDHISCATNLDEDIWEDIMNLRKNVVKIFEAEGEDIIFFECATNLDKFPHMQLHCVPVPKEAGDVAPLYFKKALLECEMEWSNNKKVVDLKGRNVRKAIPKGLPYFAVDFAMQPGYAHVIEDKRLFPKNFAQEIIGGLLDIDHSKWRKLHKDSQESIQKKVQYIKSLLQKHL